MPGEARELDFKQKDGEKRKRLITHGFLGTQLFCVPPTSSYLHYTVNLSFYSNANDTQHCISFDIFNNLTVLLVYLK